MHANKRFYYLGFLWAWVLSIFSNNNNIRLLLFPPYVILTRHAKKTKMPFGLRNSKNALCHTVLLFTLSLSLYLSLSLSLSLIPKSELHKSVQTWSFLLKITAFETLTSIKLKVSLNSLCMQVNLVVFFSCALKLFGFRFPNYIVVVRKMKSGIYLCNFPPVLCCVVPFMLITLICMLHVWIMLIAEGVRLRLCTPPLRESIGRRRRQRV